MDGKYFLTLSLADGGGITSRESDFTEIHSKLHSNCAPGRYSSEMDDFLSVVLKGDH